MNKHKEFASIINKMLVEFLDLTIDCFDKLFQLNHDLALNLFRL